MELDTSALQATKPKKVEPDERFSEEDLVALETASDNALYPSEIGKKKAGIKEEIIKVEPKQTRLWAGNPRNFSFHSDLSDLVEQIKLANGNIQPVIARRLAVADEDGIDIEVIAGSRRRQASIEASTMLEARIVKADDNRAKIIAETENKGRQDTDLFTDCRYLKYTFDKLKSTNKSLTVEAFASMQTPVVSRQTMNDKLNLAEIDIDIQKTVKDPSAWSFRKGVKLKSLLGDNNIELTELKMALENKSFSKPDGLLDFLVDYTGAKKVIDNTVISLGNTEVVISPQKSGNTKIVLPKGSEPLMKKIESIIKEYATKNN